MINSTKGSAAFKVPFPRFPINAVLLLSLFIAKVMLS